MEVTGGAVPVMTHVLQLIQFIFIQIIKKTRSGIEMSSHNKVRDTHLQEGKRGEKIRDTHLQEEKGKKKQT